MPRGGIRSCTCVSVPGPLHSQSPGLTARGLACPEQPFICDGWEMVVNTRLFSPWQDTLRVWTTASQKSPVGLSPGAPSGRRALCMGPFPSHLISPTPRVLFGVISQINCELESLSQGLPLEQSNLEQGPLPTEVCTRRHSICPFFWPGSLPAYELH